MTTTALPAAGPTGRTPRVLLVAGVSVAITVVLVSVLGAIVSGTSAGLGAMVGGGIVGVFLLSGSAIVNAAVRMAPQAAMVVAVMTYTLQVALVLIVFIALSESATLTDSLSSGWIAGGVIAATLAWTAGQMVGTARARIPVYDVELPVPAARAAEVPSRPGEVSAP